MASAKRELEGQGPVPGCDVVLRSGLTCGRAGEQPLLLDLYLPLDAGEPRPLIAWIHGGGWQEGSRNGGLPDGEQGTGPQLLHAARGDWRLGAQGEPAVPLWLVEEGYVLASIDYRLSPGALFPAQIEDCETAVRWLRENAAEYGIDPTRVGVWGVSAGGHLAALLGATDGEVSRRNKRRAHGASSSLVQAVCAYCAPTDFPAMLAHRGRDACDWTIALISSLLGRELDARCEAASRASPARRVGPDSPPFLIVNGERDPLVPVEQGRLLHQALRNANVEADLRVLPEAEHIFINADTDRLTASFFAKHLGAAT